MQLAELLIELVIAWPRPKAASAMPAPMIARISAYSAAEAPDWSFSMLMKVFMSYSSTQAPRCHPRHEFRCFAWIGEVKRTLPSRCQMEPSKTGSQLVAPSAQQLQGLRLRYYLVNQTFLTIGDR